MNKLNKYIFKSFFNSFFTIFFVLGIIISLVFIVYISNVTSNFQISFAELLKMYFLTLPQIIFISISISFFISSVNIYSSLSETQELVAVFALGIKPLKILKPIIVLSLIFTFINLFTLLISIPYSKMAFINFKSEKKQEARFNFQSSKLSQQIGEWSFFANGAKNKKEFKNVYLFNKTKNELILAKNADIKIKNHILYFTLYNGKIYDFNKTFIINYKIAQLHNIIPLISISIFNFKNYLNYNKKMIKKYFPFALIPFAFLFFIPVFSFFHPRLQNNKSLIYSIILLSIYLTLAFLNKHLIVSIILPFIFFIIGVFIYKWKVKF